MKNLNWTRTWLLCSVILGMSVLSRIDSQVQGTAWAADAKGGTFSGQVVLQGEIPVLKPVATDMDAKGADQLKACGVKEVPNERLVVDPKSKGIKNVFVYLQKAPAGMPAEFKKSKESTVDFDQKGCQFLPHALIVRNDQTVKVLSQDPVGHNTHTSPFRNQPFNQAIKPMERTGVTVPCKMVERLPMKVQCDIHPWMSACWLVVDHPYAAVTDEQGKFRIEGLPPGEHKFTVWQENMGYIAEPGGNTVTVKIEAGKETEKKIEADVKKFK